MKTLTILFSLLILSTICFGQVNPNYHYVNGYYRSNGTYVQGHYRTDPNYTNRDNYSTYPNVNPHTGKHGTVAPDNNYSSTAITIPDTKYISQSSSSSDLFEYNKTNNEELKRQRQIDEKAWRDAQNYNKKQEKEWNERLIELEKELKKETPFNINKYMSEKAMEKVIKEYDIKISKSEIIYSPFDITRPKNAKTFTTN